MESRSERMRQAAFNVKMYIYDELLALNHDLNNSLKTPAGYLDLAKMRKAHELLDKIKKLDDYEKYRNKLSYDDLTIKDILKQYPTIPSNSVMDIDSIERHLDLLENKYKDGNI